MYVPKVMLYITSAMTHLAPEIRGDSTKFLRWLLDINKDLALCNGGWAKGLRGLIGVLGWGTAKDNGCLTGGGSAAKGKIRIQHLGVLQEFLQAGLLDDNVVTEHGNHDGLWRSGIPHWTTRLHIIPTKPSQSNCFAYLGLFSMANNGDEEVGIEDMEARKRWLAEGPGMDAFQSLRTGVEGVRKEGGEIGRLGAKILAILEGALSAASDED